MTDDVFFSIAQTPVNGVTPTEAVMFENFFAQVEAADALGFGTAWIAESHLSSQVQKQTSQPVIPHWEGEVGLNVDFHQLATRIFQRTKRIEAGSAILNVLCNGGPVAHAERTAAFLMQHGLDADEKRRIHLGFAAGRFDFMNLAYGIGPRNELERLAWPALKGQVFRRAARIFVRLLRGDALASAEVPTVVLRAEHFRKPEQFDAVRELAGTDHVEIPPFFDFEILQIVPREWRRELLQLVVGSHDPVVQVEVNEILPVHVFNLSITRSDVIDATHQRMTEAFHPDGGPWKRQYMPRTVFVFLNEQPGLSAEQRRASAHDEARAALGAYWQALDGTIDSSKVEKAADNALVGDAEQVAQQAMERFHPDDRLMLWFDFFNHDSDRVVANMEAWATQVAPKLEAWREQS